MSKGFGVKCAKCSEVLFGIAWMKGERVIYSNCLCSGYTVKMPYIPLKEAIKILGPKKKDFDGVVITVPESELTH